MVAIFSYGFEIAKSNFEQAHIELHTMSTYNDLLTQALETNYISKEELAALSEWNANPSEWNAI